MYTRMISMNRMILSKILMVIYRVLARQLSIMLPYFGRPSITTLSSQTSHPQ